jgi:hypothetical protein
MDWLPGGKKTPVIEGKTLLGRAQVPAVLAKFMRSLVVSSEGEFGRTTSISQSLIQKQWEILMYSAA